MPVWNKCKIPIFKLAVFLFLLFFSLLKATRGDPKEVITSGDKFWEVRCSFIWKRWCFLCRKCLILSETLQQVSHQQTITSSRISFLGPRLPFLPLQLHPSPHPCFRIYCVLICFFSKCSFRSEQETKSKEKDMEMERYDITKERHLLCLNKSYHSFWGIYWYVSRLRNRVGQCFCS